ncbi:MAG: hypothetical protein M1829_002059 [Trizodia sp. TS-e1964]|nr:MAG: hypothetical protein M1829_002059 [Trizodia sp. TS-e1964]
MTFYDSNQPWPTSTTLQKAWENPPVPAPARAGSASITPPREDVSAFHSQLDEVDRAIDNLHKSGKMFNNLAGRRDSMPIVGPGPRPYSEYGDARIPVPQRHHSLSEFDPMRSHSASNLQNFYATQRYQPRPNEAEQMMQAKRRMAAQRERELRNYHQEQQYNRNRTISPGTMSEDDCQNGSASFEEAHLPRGITLGPVKKPSSATSARGPSPLAFDPFGMIQSDTEAPKSPKNSSAK